VSARLPRTVAIVGVGEIGSGWAALFAAHGVSVRLFDPDPNAEWRARAQLTCARAVLRLEGEPGTFTMHARLAEALEDAEWIQESLPEQIALKRTLYTIIDARAPKEAIIASSTSTYTIPDLISGLWCADRTIIAHPLHPVYAVPVVELVGSAQTTPEIMRRAETVLRTLGREPITIRTPVRGLVSNRLTAALLREAFDLVARGVIDARDLDRLVSRGIALGWVTAGPLRTEAIGGGSRGFAAFLDRLAEPLSQLWRSLAGWHALEPRQRYALERSMAARGVARDTTAHAPDECAWAEWLHRAARETEER
jgi:3-hydroxyacyl-CoA dehydrogenase